MSETNPVQPTSTNTPPANDEGGLHAPPDLHGWRKAWWWFDFIILVKLARLRFIGVLLVIGIVLTQWDALVNYYDRLTRRFVAQEKAAPDEEYFCPMDPGVVSNDPKEKCPICFMALAKRKKGATNADPLPAGVVNRVQLTPYRMVLAGVATFPIDYQPLTKRITAVGYVEFNERGERTVSARVAGRIDKLIASETGRMVGAGDDLALLYSPDLLVTEQNLLSAKHSGNQDLVKSARVRLELLGIDDAQIDEILAADAAPTHLKIRSPISGHVIKKYVREGQYVEEGTPLYDVADLSTVWIQAQLYEDDLAFLPSSYEHGTAPTESRELDVTATTRSSPNELFRGKLAFVYPHVDQETRTVTVRFEIANPGHRLRPGTTANVVLTVPPEDVRAITAVAAADPHASEMLADGRVLAVPEISVIDTGTQRIVYRQAAPGVFEGVEVELGPRMTNAEGMIFYPILRGLAAGESVITTGSFLVDAETRLNPAAGSIYFGGSGGQKDAAAATTVRPSTPQDPDAKVVAGVAGLAPADRALAAAQRFCPVRTDSLLGSMGTPVKLTIEGQIVFLCCAGCKDRALAEPRATLANVAASTRAVATSTNSADGQATTVLSGTAEKRLTTQDERTKLKAAEAEAKIVAALAKLLPADRSIAEAQRFCPVLKDSRLGSMGTPIKLVIDGQPIFICCEGCASEARENPAQTLETVKWLKASTPLTTPNE